MSSWTAASSDCSRPVNNYVHVKTADLYRPNARLTPERQGYQVLTPFGKLGYSLKTGIRRGDVYAFPRQKSVDHFKDQIRKLTCRKAPVTTQALIDQINPIIRGWGNYFCKAHVRTLFAPAGIAGSFGVSMPIAISGGDAGATGLSPSASPTASMVLFA